MCRGSSTSEFGEQCCSFVLRAMTQALVRRHALIPAVTTPCRLVQLQPCSILNRIPNHSNKVPDSKFCRVLDHFTEASILRDLPY